MSNSDPRSQATSHPEARPERVGAQPEAQPQRDATPQPAAQPQRDATPQPAATASIDAGPRPHAASARMTAAERAADPVLIKRAKIAKWTLLANRIGYLFVALAMALFFMAFAFGFTSVMATLVIVALVIGCALLAPSIILGYAVKAADREDRENGL